MHKEDFGHLARQYSRLIRSAVARVAGPSATGICDDVEQKVLIALWQAMPGEQMPDHPSSYIGQDPRLFNPSGTKAPKDLEGPPVGHPSLLELSHFLGDKAQVIGRIAHLFRR